VAKSFVADWKLGLQALATRAGSNSTGTALALLTRHKLLHSGSPLQIVEWFAALPIHTSGAPTFKQDYLRWDYQIRKAAKSNIYLRWMTGYERDL